MSIHLWKLIAVKDNGRLTKGMSIEILVKGSLRKPNAKEIVKAINQKYDVDVATSSCGASNFEYF